jgi:adenosylcobinamide kinase / adenosylcobinamide-phosphate guanylyltransferase
VHVYIGGAHNGKRDFVKKTLGNQDIEWFEGALPNCISTEHNSKIVIAGLEKWLSETELSEEDAVAHVLAAVAGRDTIFILTDFGRGIVPIDAKQRQLRDICGRLYQRLIAEADEVTRIWYGISQTLKKRGE